MKKKLLVASFILSATFPFPGCKKPAEELSAKPKNLPSVRVTPAQEGPIAKTLNLTGSVTATKIAKMGSPAEGPILLCQVREGDTVTAGQLLLAIGRNKTADAMVQAAQDALAREQEEWKRITKLVESGAIAAEELETANLRVSRAKAELAKAMESLEDYQIKAPWNGVVSKVFVKDGYYVAPRESLLEMYDPASTVIEFAIPEAQAAMVHMGMPVEVELDAYPAQSFQGKLTKIYPELSPQTRTRTAEAALFYQDRITLLPGMFARIRLILETVEKAVLIPDKAIVSNAKNEPTAFVLIQEKTDPSGLPKTKVEARKLTLGIEKNRTVQVIEGIKPGERVVVEGNEKLKNGTDVNVIPTQISSEKIDSGDKK